MSHALYKATITEHGYDLTTYTAWVSASSKNQAIAKAAALAGQEKTRRQFERMGRLGDLAPCGLLAPQVTLEPVTTDEYYEHEEEVIVA